MPLDLGISVPSSNTALGPLRSATVSQLSPGVSVHFSGFSVTEICLPPAALAREGSPILLLRGPLADARVGVIVGLGRLADGWDLGKDETVYTARYQDHEQHTRD